MAIFQAGYSAPSSVDNGTLRVDQQFGERLHLFGCVSYTRSDTTARNTTALSWSARLELCQWKSETLDRRAYGTGKNYQPE